MGFSSLYFAVQLEAKMNKHSAYAQSLGHKNYLPLAAMLPKVAINAHQKIL